MDLLSRLPQECLQLILEVIAQESDTATLAALVQTTKYIATLVLPLLYANPFQKAFHIKEAPHHHRHGHGHCHRDHDNTERNPDDNEQGCNDHEHDQEQEQHHHNQDDHVRDDSEQEDDGQDEGFQFSPRSEHALACMLLSRLPVNTLPPAISLALAAIKPTSQLSAPPSSLDYTKCIRHLTLPISATWLPLYWHPDRPPAEALRYLRRKEFGQICQSIGLLPAYTKFFEDENGDKTQLLQMFYNAFLYRESCWSLASPILEQLRSLTIPVSDLGRYSSSLSRLGTLERLHFCLDKVVDYDWNEFEDDDEVTQEVMGATQECSKDLYQSVAQFVENHARLFQGRLKAVTFTDSGLWPNIEQSCPEATRREIIRLLPPLHNPRSLDDTNLVTLAAHLDSTDLTNVARIFNLQGPDYWFHILRDSPQFLQRCRSLKELFMEPLGQGAFAWAVQEKCAFLSGQGPYLEHELISLERISIHESEDALLTTELDDIAVAFSETLESIIFTMAPVLPPPPRTTHIGQGWPDLPVLTNIVANAAQDRLVMDPQLLRRCPNIERVTVVDHTSHYKWRDHQPIQSAQLPKLEHLRLIGTSALTFHPDTLHSTTALEYVHIGTWPNNTGHYFIPTPEELRESFDFGVDSTQRPAAFRAPFRPLWTWDWYLPSLEHLILGGEFAFMFEFMMLQGCPSLYFLALDMKFSNRQIARSITNDDMFLSSTDHNSATSKTALVVPSLRILKLKGQWMLKDSLLPQFLSVMLPNLEYLEEQGMGKYTLDGLVQVVKTKPNRIEELSLDKLVVYEDIEDNSMGLQLCQGDEPVPEESENAAIVVQLGHLKYFFLKDASASAQV